MNKYAILAALMLAVGLIGCSKTEEATDPGTGTTTTGSGDKGEPANAGGGIAGTYAMHMTPEMQKQLDDQMAAGKKALADMEKMAATNPAVKAQYDAAKKQLEDAEKNMTEVFSRLTLTLNADKSAKMTSPAMGADGKPGATDDVFDGTWEESGPGKVKVTMKTKNGKPDPDIDKEPTVEMTWDEKAGTLTGTRGGQSMTFKKK
jgi:uncharacterized lipoprotein NlpE involved in copper resistance